MARKGFGNMKPKTGKNDSLRLEEVVDIYHFRDHADEWIQCRFLDSDILPVKRHWIKIFAGKEKKLVTVPRFCVSFDPDTEETNPEVHCPYCDLSSEGGQDATMRSEHFYLVNAIIRDLQEDEPARKAEPTSKEKKTGYKDIKSKSWSPVRVLRLTNSLVARMQELGENNIVKNKKTGQKKAYDVSHPKFGCDINIKYKPKAAGTDKYSADKVDGRTPLTEEEQEYLVWQLSPEVLDIAGRMSEKQAAEDFKRMSILGEDEMEGDEEDDELDEDDLDLGSSASKRKKKASAFDGDDDDDDDEDEEEEKPKKRKKKKVEDKPKKKKKKKSAFDDGDEEEDKPKKKKKKKKVDEDADSDDDDEDKPKKRKKKKKVEDKPKKKKKSKKKSTFDDDDDDWED